MPRAIARLNRRVTNRLMSPLAGRVPPIVTVVHEGRESGRTYRTPVWAFRTGDGWVMALTYGPDTEWAKNVQASGRCTVEAPGGTIHVTEVQRLRGDEGRRLMPAPLRPAMRVMGVTDYLKVTSSPPSRHRQT
jgi:deazaflavin-dependent oxidoreductase (nitroreductase family)